MQFPAKISKALLALMLATPVIAALPSTANAQAVTGSIAGRVTDPSGALVPNATVTIRNNDLGTSRILITSRDGAFRASGLISGAYTVDAKADNLALRRPVRISHSPWAAALKSFSNSKSHEPANPPPSVLGPPQSKATP